LVKEIQQKEFLQLITRHQGIVRKVSRLYCDNPEDRKDLFQEILLQLWKSFDSFRKDSSFATWMYRVSLNTAITYLRGNSREKALVRDMPGGEALENFSEEDERKEMLFDAIGQLSLADKSIIILYLDNYKYEEIADILGISVSNTGVKINRIKKKLEKLLTNMGYGL